MSNAVTSRTAAAAPQRSTTTASEASNPPTQGAFKLLYWAFGGGGTLGDKPFRLPAGAELWLCGADGLKQGPYTGAGPKDRGEQWTAVVPGARMRLELLVPEAARDSVELKIAEIFAAYR